MFINWLLREPTPTGWFFTKTIVTTLGEDFINYLFEKVDDGMNSDGTEVTKESLLEAVKELMNSFASDINILYEYVELYYEEYPEKLNQETASSTVPQPRDPKTGRFMKK